MRLIQAHTMSGKQCSSRHVLQISPGQQQWWEAKARNFDSVLLFKMGKFYEMFEMDAYVGVEILGLVLMKVRNSTSVV